MLMFHCFMQKLEKMNPAIHQKRGWLWDKVRLLFGNTCEASLIHAVLPFKSSNCLNLSFMRPYSPFFATSFCNLTFYYDRENFDFFVSENEKEITKVSWDWTQETCILNSKKWGIANVILSLRLRNVWLFCKEVWKRDNWSGLGLNPRYRHLEF